MCEAMRARTLGFLGLTTSFISAVFVQRAQTAEASDGQVVPQVGIAISSLQLRPGGDFVLGRPVGNVFGLYALSARALVYRGVASDAMMTHEPGVLLINSGLQWGLFDVASQSATVLGTDQTAFLTKASAARDVGWIAGLSPSGELFLWSVEQPDRPLSKWSVPRDCTDLMLRPDGLQVVLRCESQAIVKTVDTGEDRSLPLPPGATDARWGVPNPSVVLNEAGTHLVLLSRGDNQTIGAQWINVATGVATAPVMLTAFGGVHEADGGSALVGVVDRKQIIAVTPRMARTEVATFENVSALTYDPQRRLWVLVVNGNLVPFDGKGSLGIFGSSVLSGNQLRVIEELRRVDLALAKSIVRPPEVVEIDLAEGRLSTPPDPRSPEPPLSAIQPSGLRDPAFIDVRPVKGRPTRREIPIKGLDRLGPRMEMVRVSPRYGVYRGEAGLGLIDFKRRRVIVRYAKDTAELSAAVLIDLRPTVAYALQNGQYEVWRGRKRQLTYKLPDEDRLVGLALLPDGRMFASKDSGLYSFRSHLKPRTMKLEAKVGAFKLELVAGGEQLLLNGVMQSSFLCPTNRAAFKPDACKAIPAAFLVPGPFDRYLFSLQGGATVSVFDAQDGTRVVDIYASNESGGALFVTPDNDYFGSPEALRSAVWRTGTKVRPLDNQDVVHFRPSKILARLGQASPTRLAQLRRLEEARQARKRAQATPASKGRVALEGSPPLSAQTSPLPLSFRISSPEARVRLNALVNGVPVFGRSGRELDGRGGGRASVSLPLFPGRNEVRLLTSGGELDEAFVVHRAGTGRWMNVWLLGIGVSDYAEAEWSLRYARKDVEDVAQGMLTAFGKRLHQRLLVDEDATHEAIVASKVFLQQAAPEDLVIVYMAGHGLLDDRDDYFFAPYDMAFDTPAKTGVSVAALEDLLDGLRSGAKLVFLDSCHAGRPLSKRSQPLMLANKPVRGIKLRAPRGMRRRKQHADAASSPPAQHFGDIETGTGATILAASSATELAYEMEGIANGVFSRAVIDVLAEGIGVPRTGRLGIPDLIEAIRQRVVELTSGAQRPEVRQGNPAFNAAIIAPDPAAPMWAPPGGGRLAVAEQSADLTQVVMVLTDQRAFLVDIVRAEAQRLPNAPASCEKNACSLWLQPTGVFLSVDNKAWLWRTGATSWQPAQWPSICNPPAEWTRSLEGYYTTECSPSGKYLMVARQFLSGPTPIRIIDLEKSEVVLDMVWDDPALPYISVSDQEMIAPSWFSTSQQATLVGPKGRKIYTWKDAFNSAPNRRAVTCSGIAYAPAAGAPTLDMEAAQGELLRRFAISNGLPRGWSWAPSTRMQLFCGAVGRVVGLDMKGRFYTISLPFGT